MEPAPGFEAIAISDVEHVNLWSLIPDAELTVGMDPRHARWQEVRAGRDVVTSPSYFEVETRLLDPELPVHDDRAQGPWLSEPEWDFLVYANARLGKQACQSARMWAQENSALRAVGLSPRQRANINNRLVAAGAFLAEDVDGKPSWAVMAAPCPSRDDLVFPAERRSRRFLDDQGSYFRVPNSLMDDSEWRFWRHLRTHALRRLLLTLYSFTRYRDFGGVDPNHLHIERDHGGLYWIIVSEQLLLRARLSIGEVREGLGILFNWRRPRTDRLYPLITLPRAELVVDEGYDGTEHRLVYVSDGGNGTYHLVRPRLAVEFDVEDMFGREVPAAYRTQPLASHPSLRSLNVPVAVKPIYWCYRPGTVAARPTKTWTPAPTPDSAAADFAAAVAALCGPRRAQPFSNVAITAQTRPVQGQNPYKVAKNIVDGIVRANLRDHDRSGIDRVDIQVQDEDEGWSTIFIDCGNETVEATPRTLPYGKQAWRVFSPTAGEIESAVDRPDYERELLSEADTLEAAGLAASPSGLNGLSAKPVVVHVLVGGASLRDMDNVVGRALDQLHFVTSRVDGRGLHPAGTTPSYRLIYRHVPDLYGCFLSVYDNTIGDSLP